jgi:polyphosphate kinase
LEEAEDSTQPLLERVKFLSIFFSNLDEFFMIRISGLREQLASGIVETSPDGMTPSDQLTSIRQELHSQLARATDCWHHELLPGLDAAEIYLFSYDQLKPKHREVLRRYFIREVFPALTPLAFDPTHPFPHISNLTLNLAVVAYDPERGECFARVKVPNIFPRLIRIQKEEAASESESDPLAPTKDNHFVWLEDIIADNLDLLFPGLTIKAAYLFRITRDADLEIEEDEAADLLSSIEEQIDLRHFGSVIRLELDQKTPDSIRDILIRNLNLASYQVYTYVLPLGLSNIIELHNLDKPELKYTPFLPATPPRLAKKESLISAIRHDDILLHHP